MRKLMEMLLAALFARIVFYFNVVFLSGVLLLLIWVVSDWRKWQKPQEKIRVCSKFLSSGMKSWGKLIAVTASLTASWFNRQSGAVKGVCGIVALAMITGGGIWLASSGETSVPEPVNASPTTYVPIPYPDLVPAPLGVDRHNTTAEQLEWRRTKIIETRTFWIMREKGAVKGAERITSADYQQYLTAAAKLYNVAKEDIEAIHYLESFGDEEAKSPTGPIGPGQFARRTAASIGPVKDGKCLLVFKGYPCGSAIPESTKDLEVEIDNRKDLELSVYATAKLLSEEQEFFGSADFAIAAYHSGKGDIRAWVKKFLEPIKTTVGGKADIEGNGLTYAKLYFGSTPYKNPGTYKLYRKMMDVDWGPNYLWKVRCAQNLLNLYRQNPAQFKKLADDNKYKGERARYRMWTFYGTNDQALISVSDLKAKIESGELVVIPQDPEKFGFKLRLEGSGVIGELDKANQKYYIATKPETAGCLLWIGQELKRLREVHNKKPFVLDVTSVTRTVEYQDKLTKKNSTATKQLSFHVLGMAFDITKSGLTEDQQQDLRFILDELDSTGMISWIPENAAFHQVVAPDDIAEDFFRRIYRDSQDFQTPSPLVVSQ